MGGVVFPHDGRDAEIGAREGRAKLRDELLAGIAFVAVAAAAEVARQALLMFRPGATFMRKRGGVALGIPEARGLRPLKWSIRDVGLERVHSE